MAEPNDTGAPENTETPGETTLAALRAKTPRSVKSVAAVGIPVSLIAAAAVSFAGLTELGTFAGIDHPWLMPVAIDVYATTSTLIAMLLPEAHRARATAVWHARLGLAMSMGGNATARALHLGASGSVATVSGALLTFVGAWPSLIVERLLQLQGRLAAPAPTVRLDPDLGAVGAAAGTAALPATGDASDGGRRRRTGAAADGESSATTAQATTATDVGTDAVGGATTTGAATADDGNDGGATVTDLADRRRSDDEWAKIAAPHYREHVRSNGGETPSGPQLAARLAAAGHAKLSPTRAREIRRATEKYLREHPETDPERAREAS